MFIEKSFITRLSYRLEGFHEKGNNVFVCRCPICGDSKKSKKKTRFNFFLHKDKWVVNCFNCGYSNTFSNFLFSYDNNLYSELKMENLKFRGVRVREEEKETIVDPVDSKFSLESLSVYNLLQTPHKEVVDYCNRRLIPMKWFSSLYATNDIKKISKVIPRYFPLEYEEGLVLVLPFVSSDNEITMIQTRYIDPNVDGRFRFQTFIIKEDALTVFNEVSVDYSRLVSVTEGPIDSLFVDNSVALAGSANKNRIKRIAEKAKKVRIIFDNDYSSNKEVLKQLKTSIDNGYNVVLYDERFKWKDINDSIVKGGWSVEELNDYLNERTFVGLRGQVELSRLMNRV